MNLFKKIFNSSRELFVASDPMLADLGHEGEFIMARIRFILILLVAVIPLKTILFEESSFENWVGVIVALIALLFATLILIGVRKKVPSRSISWISTQTDVLLVTSAEVGFLLSPTPIIASNNMVAFGLYLI
ncbi:MAG TPA: hypothetical protein PLY93_02695, partial [Turneriella sp.]|nr:hypothetical protein [Turneriella sp.]